ncbi:MAG: hypothetical protein IIY21_16365, partial [Clostridiales bacterium]|nr:hypothetical protein [Clostridiales bacterium]
RYILPRGKKSVLRELLHKTGVRKYDFLMIIWRGALVNKNWTRQENNKTLKMVGGTALTEVCTSDPPPLDRT